MTTSPATTRAATPFMASALSSNAQAATAAEQVSERCLASLGGRSADLGVVFFSKHHTESARAISATIARKLGPRCLIGCSAEAVIGGSVELEESAGVALMAASLPGVSVTAFRTEHLPRVSPDRGPDVPATAAVAGMATGDYRGTIILADPFSVPLNGLLPALGASRPEAEAGKRRAPILGGLASAGNRAGVNALILNDSITRAGGVAISLSGAVRMSPIVSQGCRAIGHPFVVTAAKGQIIGQLGGRPALEAFHEMFEALDDSVKSLAQNGLFIGRAVTEYKDRFGRDDFLIRNVIGVDRKAGAIAVADLMRVGQTIQFHLRDASSADDDLKMLLDGQAIHGQPSGVLLFTCNGRGKRLFADPSHDAGVICKAFAQTEAAEQAARAGEPIPRRSSDVPLAGLFAAGEIGPVGDDVYVHGQTACAAVFRPEE